MNVPAPDNSFDAVYEVEATCHAPEKAPVYAEVFRLLKPGCKRILRNFGSILKISLSFVCWLRMVYDRKLRPKQCRTQQN